MVARVVHSSKNDAWRTPVEVLDRVRTIAQIALDPCAALNRDDWFAEDNLTMDDDGLAKRWHGLAYVNPPYSKVAKWIPKCVEEAGYGTEIIALVASRTGARWFGKTWRSATALCYVDHRLRFVGAESSAPFDSALAYWGPRADRFLAAFEDFGELVLCNGAHWLACMDATTKVRQETGDQHVSCEPDRRIHLRASGPREVTR